MSKTTRPYGSWISPISASMVAGGLAVPNQIAVSEGVIYWSESRPREGGRMAVVRKVTGSAPEEAIPSDFNCRTRVHEYGGGAFLANGETLYCSHAVDQRLYRIRPDTDPLPITPEPKKPAGLRYADGRLSLNRKVIYCVREDHCRDGEVINEIVGLAPDGSSDPIVVASGRDFYASPRPSPDGTRLAWLQWDHPNLPWNGTELWVGEIGSDQALAIQRMIAGGPQESVFQPEWSPSGTLHFVSDRTDWWNLYRWVDEKAEPTVSMEAEFGSPQWVFGLSRYAFLPDGRIACIYSHGGFDTLALISDGVLAQLDTGLNSYYPPSVHYDDLSHQLVLIAGSPASPSQVYAVDTQSGELEALSEAPTEMPAAGYLSRPKSFTFPTAGDQQAHALYYPPTNPDFDAPKDTRPPLVVAIHGGPTGHAKPEFSLPRQYFTSRGFAVVDVNYRGSDGFGRLYRELLRGEWGVADVEDCIHVAKFLIDAGEVDPERVVIRGRSAGGYTTLLALVKRDFFRGGTSYYGVTDAELFGGQTHKFESHYDDMLIGPFPETIERYRARSPINFATRLSAPVLLLQGLEDEIVLPSHLRRFVDALEANSLPYAFMEFEGEGHGFRKAETQQRALEAELSFYGEVLGIELADEVEPVSIQNLKV